MYNTAFCTFTVQHTVPFTVQHTVPSTVQHTVLSTVQHTVPFTVQHTAPFPLQHTVPFTVQQTVQEQISSTAHYIYNTANFSSTILHIVCTFKVQHTVPFPVQHTVSFAIQLAVQYSTQFQLVSKKYQPLKILNLVILKNSHCHFINLFTFIIAKTIHQYRCRYASETSQRVTVRVF